MNNKQEFANPITILFLTLPCGISAGFVSVTLPFLLVQHGFSVAAVAAITAFGISANTWRFIWAPLADLTLSLHKWFIIGISTSVTTLFALVFIPLDAHYSSLIMFVIFASQIASTFVSLPIGGFMGKVIEEEKKGRVSGYHQAGYTGGMGIGGGAGLWLANHLSYQASVIIISLSMLLSAFALYYVPQVHSDKEKTVTQGFTSMILSLKELFRSRSAIFTTAMIMTPIGIGAASYIWSSVADDWHAKADTVALVTGILSGLASAVGCIMGGWIADKVGRWWAFFGSGTLLALTTLLMSLLPFTPDSYTIGVLCYAFMFGFAMAAFTAIVLQAIGTHLAATKYSLLISISYIAVVYMTAFDGWFHDKQGVKAMLLGETFLGLGFVAVSLFALYWLKIVDSPVVGKGLVETT
jgi:PAT family beta-lactamase induction signal transducer AmpG